jgi:hypothetical protein
MMPRKSASGPAGAFQTPRDTSMRANNPAIAPDGPIAGEVSVVEHLGGETLAYVDIGEDVLVTVKSGGDDPVSVGQAVRLASDHRGLPVHQIQRVLRGRVRQSFP